jgi:hypothetical protein
LAWTAVANKRPIEATYQGRHRLFCPHRLGRNREGRLRVLCYQYGGDSSSGLERGGSPANWRCVALEKLSRVKLVEGAWHTAPNHSRPASCVAEADIDAEESSRARSAERTLRELPEQLPGQDDSQCCNRMGIMPLGANAAIPAGGRLVPARGQRIPDGRRGQRGKNGSARPPGTHWPRCTAWRDGETRASCDLHNAPAPT